MQAAAGNLKRVTVELGGKIPQLVEKPSRDKLGSFVPARRQDPRPVRTKHRVLDTILVVKGGDERRQRLFTTND